ncbi:hypothetical protein C7441_104129 [Pseudaminobacter salicylatoxidans]|uniref:Uncharacterized protein n=1 Tax=Pseudaminobacter salicylatoxidans TaxID=93369 RepID=A0A316C590_PSESE|nr:hypothetical protein [Pseudaminobacter salicylatoxidans]PWJ84861.1 hypothetical protein C7441_104129 [Pseudaminobacter salicylatoxidans]
MLNNSYSHAAPQSCRTIPQLFAERTAVIASLPGLPDNRFDATIEDADGLEVAILKAPCADARDLKLKLKVWDALIADPACIMEQHIELWDVLKDDIERVIAGETDAKLSSERANGSRVAAELEADREDMRKRAAVIRGLAA